jgi:hypothetical protein
MNDPHKNVEPVDAFTIASLDKVFDALNPQSLCPHTLRKHTVLIWNFGERSMMSQSIESIADSYINAYRFQDEWFVSGRAPEPTVRVPSSLAEAGIVIVGDCADPIDWPGIRRASHLPPLIVVTEGQIPLRDMCRDNFWYVHFARDGAVTQHVAPIMLYLRHVAMGFLNKGDVAHASRLTRSLQEGFWTWRMVSGVSLTSLSGLVGVSNYALREFERLRVRLPLCTADALTLGQHLNAEMKNSKGGYRFAGAGKKLAAVESSSLQELESVYDELINTHSDDVVSLLFSDYLRSRRQYRENRIIAARHLHNERAIEAAAWRVRASGKTGMKATSQLRFAW